jgi:hypothetical protein
MEQIIPREFAFYEADQPWGCVARSDDIANATDAEILAS